MVYARASEGQTPGVVVVGARVQYEYPTSWTRPFEAEEVFGAVSLLGAPHADALAVMGRVEGFVRDGKQDVGITFQEGKLRLDYRRGHNAIEDEVAVPGLPAVEGRYRVRPRYVLAALKACTAVELRKIKPSMLALVFSWSDALRVAVPCVPDEGD